MPFDRFVDSDETNEERREAVRKSIRPTSAEELRKLTDEIFDSPDHPWRQTYLELIAENPQGAFYQANAGEGLTFLYSRDADKGLWWIQGGGVGRLSEKGRQMMKEAIR